MAKKDWHYLYNTKLWRQSRRAYLAENPLCVHCNSLGVTRASQVVDHIVPHKGDLKKFWDDTNWQALCKHCHDKMKSRAENRPDRIGFIDDVGLDGWPIDPNHPVYRGGGG